MKLAILEWKKIVRITGGFLALDKIAWYLVGYEWRQGKWKRTNPGQDKILEDNNKTRKEFPLQYLEANEAMLMLGMYLEPNGNNKDQVKYIKKKSTKWETSVRAGGVQQNEARKALNSTTPQNMKYPLSAMSLNEKECKNIMLHIVKCGLTKADISSTPHTVVRYGPWSLVSIGIFDPFMIQGVGRIAFLIEKYCKLNPSRPLLWANLFNIQLETGRGGHILKI